jgi:hypothetical protein
VDEWPSQDALSSGYKSYLRKGTDTYTGQNVGLLTRVDPVEDLWRSSNTAPYPISGSQCGYSGSAGTYGCSKVCGVKSTAGCRTLFCR